MHVTTPAALPRQTELAPGIRKNIPRYEQSLETWQQQPPDCGVHVSLPSLAWQG